MINRKPQINKTIICLFLSLIGSHTGFTQQLKKNQFPIDFSCSGYGGGGISIPQVETTFFVNPTGNDDTRLLQAAIDSIVNHPLNNQGFRGTLQLSAGEFKISGQIKIRKSGIVIRGTNKGGKSVLIATGNDRRTLIKIQPDKKSKLGNPIEITDSIVPAGAMSFRIKNTENFVVGDPILITRPSTKEWISDIGMDKKEGTFAERRGLIWLPDSKNLAWDRKITAVDKQQGLITIDAPVTTAMESLYGGGTVQKIIQDNRVHQIGLENIELKSEYDLNNKQDEEHSWIAIAINQAEDCWVKDVVAKHFVSSLIHVGHHGRRISILDCQCEEPISEAAGFRRQSFWIEGQQVLVKNCTADSGMNDFAIGLCAAGPNVFLDCTATNALDASGASESWASGTLYENVKIEGAGLRLTYDFNRTQGGGWMAVNSVVWNCISDQTDVIGPYCAPNYLIDSADSSLYQSQLQKRTGIKTVSEKSSHKKVSGNRSKSAQEFKVTDIPPTATKPLPQKHTVDIVNGRFVKDGKLVWAGLASDPLWKGQTSPNPINRHSSITVFVPGKEGAGLTEDLPVLVDNLLRSGNCFYNSFPGLWYDRRRDDHTINKRADKNVWAPFYEMTWARTGKGEAWDGLSKFDLSKYNPWYFNRVREFASLCDEKGIAVFFNFYNTHNLLEYLTHWVDFPWRPANNINQTGLEEPPHEPWARMHVANQFYDPTNPELRKLHKAYIFHLLDEVGEFQNSFFTLATEYAGPLNFQRFFIETVHEWEQQNHKNIRLILAAAKNVTDSILADPELAAQIDVIDTRYWQYRSEIASFSYDNKLWAPPGGTNRSFREMVGESFILQSGVPFPTTEENMYKEVREYRDRFPGKAIISASNNVSPIPSLMAGGALVLKKYEDKSRPGHITFDIFVNEYLSDLLMHLNPSDKLLEDQTKNWCMTDSSNSNILLYSVKGKAFQFASSIPGKSFSGTWYDPVTERIFPFEGEVSIEKGTKIVKPTSYNWLLLLKEK